MRLSHKIILVTSGIVAVMGLATIVAINGVVKGVVRDSIQQNGIALAQTIAANVADQYLDGNVLAVKNVLENQKDSTHYMVYAYIINRNDGTVVDTFTQGFLKDLVAVDPIQNVRTPMSRLLNMGGDLVRDVGVPLVSGLDSIELHIGLSESTLLVPLTRISWVIMVLTLIGILIGSFAALLLSRLITRPLMKLTRQAVRIGEGNLESEILVESQDEVGNLARSFNTMTHQLKDTIQALQRRNEELSLLSHKLAEREDVLGKLWQKVISAQEEERKRIARELHDETTQSLAAITVGLKTAETVLMSDRGKGMTLLEQIRMMAGQVVKELHNIVYDLRPTILDDLGLIPALRWYGEIRLGAQGVKFDLQVQGINRRFPAEVETTFFRIGQESISNIFRHAQACEVVLTLVLEDDALIMKIADDGYGFDIGEVWQLSEGGVGLGLLGMRERVALLGGTIDINSRLGRGTVVTVKVELLQNGITKGGLQAWI